MNTPPPDERSTPPTARKVPTVSETHGDRRVDDYAWLREKASPEVKAYLEAENAHTAAILEPLESSRKTLYEEMVARIKETDVGVPWRKGGWLYYARTEKGLQYAIRCRREDRPGAPEEVTLDLNDLGREEPFMALGAYEVSDDARLLAYSTDNRGFREYTLFVKDLETGEVRETVAERTGAVAWAADNRTLFYTVEEESTKRHHRVYRHEVGTDDHDLVFEEDDPAFNVSVDRTRSGAYLLLDIGSLTTSEARFLPAVEPRGEWRLVAARVPEQEYEVDHRGSELFCGSTTPGATSGWSGLRWTPPGERAGRRSFPTGAT